MRTRAFWLLALTTVAAAGCKDNPPPGCRIAESITLPASPLTQTKNVVLQRAGDGFLLVGSEGDEVRWAPLGSDGKLGTESKLTLPLRVVRPEPWFGAVAKSAPADQLVVVYVAPRAGDVTHLQITAVTQSPGGAPSAPTVVADLPAGVDRQIVRLAMVTSRSGKRSVLTWGYEGQDAVPTVLVLKEDGQPVAPPAPLHAGARPRWSCLSAIPGRGDFAVSELEADPTPGVPPTWRAFEVTEDAGRGGDFGVPLEVTPTGCVTSAPTPRGYLLAYQNNNGTFFSDFYNLEKGLVNSGLIAGVLQFGGVARQPPVACVAAMGADYSFLFDRHTGPEVWRFDAFSKPQGSPFVLTSGGMVGPVSGQPGPDTFFATYLDEGQGATAGNSRYFVRVDCPMQAPLFTPDASADTAPAAPDIAGVDGAGSDGGK
jgi:hypothetical protein